MSQHLSLPFRKEKEGEQWAKECVGEEEKGEGQGSSLRVQVCQGERGKVKGRERQSVRSKQIFRQREKQGIERKSKSSCMYRQREREGGGRERERETKIIVKGRRQREEIGGETSKKREKKIQIRQICVYEEILKYKRNRQLKNKMKKKIKRKDLTEDKRKENGRERRG